MQEICKNPQPTHDDMALIAAQGRDPQAVNQDVAAARANDHARRMGPNPAPQWVHDDEASEPCQDDEAAEGE
jgi:hypothetical protein